jgi:ubiquitin carboxyl-terminal hydrolase 5/13
VQAEDEEPPAKMKKLAIIEEREEDKYDTTTVVKCWKCDPVKGQEIPQVAAEPQVRFHPSSRSSLVQYE